jgi:hypothetical protein
VATPNSVFGSSGSSQAAGPTLGNVSVKYKGRQVRQEWEEPARQGHRHGDVNAGDGNADHRYAAVLATKGIGFTVPARQSQAQQGPCQVFDLVLGPLHLNLLGLIVDLIQITADPNGGIIGSLLCSLTGPPPLSRHGSLTCRRSPRNMAAAAARSRRRG